MYMHIFYIHMYSPHIFMFTLVYVCVRVYGHMGVQVNMTELECRAQGGHQCPFPSLST